MNKGMQQCGATITNDHAYGFYLDDIQHHTFAYCQNLVFNFVNWMH